MHDAVGPLAVGPCTVIGMLLCQANYGIFSGKNGQQKTTLCMNINDGLYRDLASIVHTLLS
jgi:hypothetical protein